MLTTYHSEMACLTRRVRRCRMVKIRAWVLGTYSELIGFALRSKSS
jgi:hypothetical protein